MRKTNYKEDNDYRLIIAAIRGGASDFQTWGFNDNNNSSWRAGQKAFPYTNSFAPKPAYYVIKEALIDMSSVVFWKMDAPVNGIFKRDIFHSNTPP